MEKNKQSNQLVGSVHFIEQSRAQEEETGQQQRQQHEWSEAEASQGKRGKKSLKFWFSGLFVVR